MRVVKHQKGYTEYEITIFDFECPDLTLMLFLSEEGAGLEYLQRS